MRGAVAIIGMAGRFPDAPDLEAFWRNLKDGVESVRFFTDDELREAGVDDALLHQPNYVKARAVLDGVRSLRRAVLRLQHRAKPSSSIRSRGSSWSVRGRHSNAPGSTPERLEGMIGVYAGASLNTYRTHVQSHPELLAASGRAAGRDRQRRGLPGDAGVLQAGPSRA